MKGGRFLTVRQPWASLIMAGGKDVENRPKAVPSTLPQWYRCLECGMRTAPGVNLSDSMCEPDAVQDGPFPFRLWVHAGKDWDDTGNHAAFVAVVEDRLSDAAALPRGVLLGYVTVTGCHHAERCKHGKYPGRWTVGDALDEAAGGASPSYCSPWAQPDAFHWTLADPVPLPEPIRLKGALGLPFMPDDVLAAALSQLEGVTAHG